MKIKPPHFLLVLYGLGVAAYAVHFHLFADSDERFDRGSRFAIMAFLPLVLLLISVIILYIGLFIGALCRTIAKCLGKDCDEDEPLSTE